MSFASGNIYEYQKLMVIVTSDTTELWMWYQKPANEDVFGVEMVVPNMSFQCNPYIRSHRNGKQRT